MTIVGVVDQARTGRRARRRAAADSRSDRRLWVASPCLRHANGPRAGLAFYPTSGGGPPHRQSAAASSPCHRMSSRIFNANWEVMLCATEYFGLHRSPACSRSCSLFRKASLRVRRPSRPLRRPATRLSAPMRTRAGRARPRSRAAPLSGISHRSRAGGTKADRRLVGRLLPTDRCERAGTRHENICPSHYLHDGGGARRRRWAPALTRIGHYSMSPNERMSSPAAIAMYS